MSEAQEAAGNAGDPAMSSAQLDKSALHGAAWMGAAKWSTQLVSWLGTILVARILVPHDYGVVALASVYLGLLAIVSEFGIGTTIVMQRDIQGNQLAQLNTISILLGIGSVLLSALFAWPLGVFFHSEELPWVVVAMSSTFAINALQIVPAATLRRELKFRTLAMIDVARGFLVPVGTFVFALIGMRYWALVGGAVLSSVIAVTMTLASRRHGLAKPLWHSVGSKLRFSGEILISRLAWFVYSSSDFVVAGRRLGEAPLGEYSLALTIATTPTGKIFALLTDVTPALFAAVQRQTEQLRRYFLNLTELLAFICFPVGIGMALVAADLVAVVLGDKWAGAVMPLTLLAAYSTVLSITPLYGHLFVAVGQARFSMWTSLVTAVALPVGFLIGSAWGTTGIAASWFFVHPIVTYVTYSRCRQILSMQTRDYLAALRLGFDGTIAMAAVVLALHHFLPIETPLVRLLVEVPAGALTFTGTTLALHRGRLREIVDWFRRTRSAK
jgi:teichuronic acid exporter